ncbi:DUF6869 domain-containing protein [Phenylobacterium montanum]|uniref:DUF6869 domain-containing protein n=1 Tax=Phenylobacterium montanum TaxID=2823693 RepID=A0A975IYK7_9CAUL|nr:hypothetical protein [Caulobacter sp. S6]QUD90556.1 hypothetical protein KCG34_12140 [Caulobacter sp. S6]
MQTHHAHSNEEISRSWIAHYVRMGRPSSAAEIKAHDDDPDWWAVRTLMELDRQDPARALDITFLIAKGSDDAWVVENLGAGPLEDLIDGDPTLLDAIALETASNPRLKEALQSVWQGEMSDDTWARLRRIAGS